MILNNIPYETVMVINTTLGEEGIASIIEKFKNLIESNATITEIQEWGKRKLAYEIKDQREGYYLLIRFTSNVNFPAELDRVYRITDGILRWLIIKNDKPIKKDKPAKKEKVEKVEEIEEQDQ